MNSLLTLENIIATALVLPFVAGGIWLAWSFFGKLGSLEHQSSMAEENFARELERHALGAPPESATSAAPSRPPMEQVPPPLPVAQPDAAPEQPAIAAAPMGPLTGPPTTVQEVFRRLDALGAIKSREGEIPLMPPPNGISVILKDGKTCAILPRLESEATLQAFGKRFDVLVCVSAYGDPIFVERYQSRVAGWIRLA